MNFGPDMMRDEANNPFAVGGRQPLTCVRQPIGQPVDPDASIGIEHDFDDARIFEPRGDRRPQRGAQHARTARECFRLE